MSLTSQPPLAGSHGQSASTGNPDLSISVPLGPLWLDPLHEGGIRHGRPTSSFSQQEAKASRHDAFLPSTPPSARFLGTWDRRITGFAGTLHVCIQTALGQITFGLASLGPLKELSKSGFNHSNAIMPRTQMQTSLGLLHHPCVLGSPTQDAQLGGVLLAAVIHIPGAGPCHSLMPDLGPHDERPEGDSLRLPSSSPMKRVSYSRLPASGTFLDPGDSLLSSSRPTSHVLITQPAVSNTPLPTHV